MDTVDWALLRSFLAVIEAGSLSTAAARSATTQPTLSRHIRELEAALGATLFTRSARELDPTEAALGLIDNARAMGAAAEALALKAQGRSQQLTGTVRITASVVVANLLLPQVLADLRRAEPNIQVEVVASDLTQNLLRRDADIALRMDITRPATRSSPASAQAGAYGRSPTGPLGTIRARDSAISATCLRRLGVLLPRRAPLLARCLGLARLLIDGSRLSGLDDVRRLVGLNTCGSSFVLLLAAEAGRPGQR